MRRDASDTTISPFILSCVARGVESFAARIEIFAAAHSPRMRGAVKVTHREPAHRYASDDGEHAAPAVTSGPVDHRRGAGQAM
jgi:hypothetical protein